MPSRDAYGYSSSNGSSRSSSSSSAADIAKQLGGLSINQKKAPSYEPKNIEPKYSEPKCTSQQTSARYETTLITPDTSRSRTSSSYAKPLIRDERKPCKNQKRSKTSDSRYHVNSFLDTGASYTTSSRREDSRFYPNSSFYSERR